ncbi:MAG: hypothetical protein JXB38_18930 [Anaerolineales bacterium]|nr:hypothetical protein [Anaerolineales bacterium]
MNNTNTQTAENLFERAIELEEAAETLYKRLAEMFSDHPEVARFWKHYADEERGHASYLRRIRARVDAERLAAPAESDLFEKARYCFESASPQRLKKIITLEDAYQLAVELENSETNTIFEFMIVNFSTDELAQSHRFLRTQLSTHIARLQNDFPAQYRSQMARQKVLAAK